MGVVPTITIDKTDGCHMYLNDQTLNVEIVSSKSSEMNVLIPTPSGDYVSSLAVEMFHVFYAVNFLNCIFYLSYVTFRRRVRQKTPNLIQPNLHSVAKPDPLTSAAEK